MSSSLGRAFGGFVDRVLSKKTTAAPRAGSAAAASDGLSRDEFKTKGDMLRNMAAGGEGIKMEDIVRGALDSAAAESTNFVPGSLLFVPCSNTKALQKVPKLSADAFILDLEDSVPVAKKEAARENLYTMCKAGAFGDKKIYVRVNSLRDAPQFGFHDLDTCGVLRDSIAGVCLPKTEMGDFEASVQSTHPDLGYFAFIETARGVIDVDAIAASGYFKGLFFGSNDLGSDLQLPSSDWADGIRRDGTVFLPPRVALQHSMSRVILAARANKLPVFDGVYNDFNDPMGFRRDCIYGRALGFDGKTLIHPGQVPACNEVYDPSAAEVAYATKVISAMAMSEGGAVVCEGKMIEEMHARQAKATVARNAVAKKRGQASTAAPSALEVEEAAARLLRKEDLERKGAYEEEAPCINTSSNMPTLGDIDRRVMTGTDDPFKRTSTLATSHGGRSAPKRRTEDGVVMDHELHDILSSDQPDPSEFVGTPADGSQGATAAPAADADASPASSKSSSRFVGLDDAGRAEEASIRAQSEQDRREAREARGERRGRVPTRMQTRDFKKVKDDEAYEPINDVPLVRFR